MQHKYCLPIITRYTRSLLDIIHQYERQYAFFEVWVDYLEDADEAFIAQLADTWPGRIIIVFRRKELHPMHMPLASRLQIISALNQSTALIDLDLASQAAELDFIRTDGLHVSTIVSHHNYSATPTTRGLGEIAHAILVCKPTMLKIATFCQNEQDAVRLLALQLRLREQGQRHIILGMGPHGLVTRTFGTLWGNEVIFAPAQASEQSAPGQLDRDQLDAIFRSLAVPLNYAAN